MTRLTVSEDASQKQPSHSREELPVQAITNTDTATGVATERVNPYTLQVIDQLFPGRHGLNFLAGVLRLAEVKQLALPDLDQREVTDVAVITVQNLRVLSQLIGLSYDTTEKYIVVFNQLRLLHKQRHRRQIVLHFPLSSCQLPEPEVLDELGNYRNKVTRFAHQVKRRFVLMRESGNLATQPGPLPTIQADTQPLSQKLLEDLCQDIRHILRQEVDSETGSRLFFKIEGAVRYRCTLPEGRLLSEKDDSDAAHEEIQGYTCEKESTFAGQKDDSKVPLSDLPGQQSLLLQRKGDSFIGRAPRKSQPLIQKGDSDHPGDEKESSFLDQKGDSLPDLTSQKSRPPRQKDDFSRQKVDSFHTKGDSDTQKGDSESLSAHASIPNVNVLLNNIINILNVNVKSVIDFLLKVLDEEPCKRGYYLNLYHKQKCQNPEIWLAALLQTIIAREKKQVDDAGKYFISRCVALHKDYTSDAAELVQQYGCLAYPQLLAVLLPLSSGKKEKKGSAADTSQLSYVPQNPARQRLTLLIAPRDKQKPGMSKLDYNRAQDLLLNHPITYVFRLKSVRQADGSWVMFVDDTLGHQCWLYSLEECQHHLARLDQSRDFFKQDHTDTPRKFILDRKDR